MLTTAAAAALLTERGWTDKDGGPVKPDTVKKWCQREKFPNAIAPTSRRGLWLIPESDLDDFTPPAKRTKVKE